MVGIIKEKTIAAIKRPKISVVRSASTAQVCCRFAIVMIMQSQRLVVHAIFVNVVVRP